MYSIFFSVCLLAAATLLPGSSAAATGPEETARESIITFWPLIDYRANTARKSSKLSLLGPLITLDESREEAATALRPLFHTITGKQSGSSRTSYLYPLASTESTPDVSRFEFLKLLQKNVFRKTEPGADERDFMLFPFIISGDSKKYGSYTSLFPLYGDIYERFWRDEYHFILFPLYGKTVKAGTTNFHFLWPFFSVTTGEKETGFTLWPLYGQASKEGVYQSRFTLWPLYSQEKRGLDTGTPSSRLSIFPFYSAFDSPAVTSRTYLWPFFGHYRDSRENEAGVNYLWPFWLTVTGNKRNITSFLPFYRHEQTGNSSKTWYLWPLLNSDSIHSPNYSQERNRFLFFIFSDKIERWAIDDKSRRRSALWPLYLYRRDTSGSTCLTLPAPLEPIVDHPEIDNLWAPLWRIYVHNWNSQGDSSQSILWNLFWHERSKATLGIEFFPFFRYRKAPRFSELQLLKGLVNYQADHDQRTLSLLWLPFGFDWETKQDSGTVPMSTP